MTEKTWIHLCQKGKVREKADQEQAKALQEKSKQEASLQVIEENNLVDFINHLIWWKPENGEGRREGKGHK